MFLNSALQQIETALSKAHPDLYEYDERGEPIARPIDRLDFICKEIKRLKQAEEKLDYLYRTYAWLK